MSERKRRPRCGFRFKPSPKQLPPHWDALSYHQRLLINDVWRITDDLNRIEVTEDWERSLCRQLSVPGPMRPNVIRSLRCIQKKARLIEVADDGFVEILMRPRGAYARTEEVDLSDDSEEVPDEVRDDSADTLLEFPSHSAHIPDEVNVAESLNKICRSEQIIEDESSDARAPARETNVYPIAAAVAQPAPTPTPATPGEQEAPRAPSLFAIGAQWWQKHFSCRTAKINLAAHKQALEWIGSQPEADRELAAKNMLASTWLAGEGKHNLNPKWLSGRWGEYLTGTSDYAPKGGPARTQPGEFVSTPNPLPDLSRKVGT